LTFRTVLGAIAALALTAFAAPVHAQGVVKAEYGDWQMSCDTPAGASFEQCALIQNVTAEDRANLGISVGALKLADDGTPMLRVVASLGVLLQGRNPANPDELVGGLGLTIDGKIVVGTVGFTRCILNGCVADVMMDSNLQKLFTEGQTAYFIVYLTPEEPIGIPVSLNGFKEGFAALP